MKASRIPAYDCMNPNGMLIWFSEMALRDLLFHPEDAPESIIRVDDGSKTFTPTECAEVDLPPVAVPAITGRARG